MQGSSPHSPNAPLRDNVVAYIREHYATALGEHIELLDVEGGVTQIMQLVRVGEIDPYA
ncbi:MAG: hypothetical protein R3C68_07060 [Myxococcota bacterium]